MKKFLLGTLLGVLIIGLPSAGFIYWYSHQHPIYLDSLEEVRRSTAARSVLGENIQPSLLVRLKVSGRHKTGEAQYGVEGTGGHATVKASAAKVGEAWIFRHIWLRLDIGRYVVVIDDKK